MAVRKIDDNWFYDRINYYKTPLSKIQIKRNMVLSIVSSMPWLNDEAFEIEIRCLMDASYEEVEETYNQWMNFAEWYRINGYAFPPKSSYEYAEQLQKYNETIQLQPYKIFISVPMTGRDHEEVVINLNKAKIYLTEHARDLNIDTSKYKLEFKADAYERPNLGTEPALYCLAEDIKILGDCDACYFCKCWKSSHGCNVEREVCKQYNIRIIDGEY